MVQSAKRCVATVKKGASLGRIRCAPRLLLLSILVLAITPLGSLRAQDTSREASRAKKLVLDKILKGDLSGKAVYMVATPISKGTIVRGWTGTSEEVFSMPFENGWFFFIDDMFGANWTHACRYIFTDFNGKDKLTIQATMPPRIFMKKVSPDGGIVESQLKYEELKESIERRKAKAAEVGYEYDAVPNGEKELILPLQLEALDGATRHALLISGGFLDAEIRHENDMRHLYYTLKHKYHYDDADITVLYADGRPLDFDCDSNPDVDGDATKLNILTQIAYLPETLDHLFVFTTNHGDTQSGPRGAQFGNSCIICWDDGNGSMGPEDLLSDAEMALAIGARIPVCATYLLEQCFGGGFIDNLASTAPTVVISTAARGDEPSWGWINSFDVFAFHYTNALRKAKPRGSADTLICKDGQGVNADANGNGIISLKEAHNYAVINDKTPEHPQYYEHPICAGDGAWAGGCDGAGDPLELRPVILNDDLCFVERGQSQAYLGFSICNPNICTPLPYTYQYRLTSKGHVGDAIDIYGEVTVPSGSCEDVYGIIDADIAIVCTWDTLTMIAWSTGSTADYDTGVQVIHVIESEPVPLLSAPIAAALLLALAFTGLIFMRRYA